MDKINDASSKFTFLFKKRLRDSEVVSLCGSSTLSFVNVLKSKKEKFILNTNLTSIPPKIGKIFVSTQKTDQSISDNSLSSLQVKKKKKPKEKKSLLIPHHQQELNQLLLIQVISPRMK